MWRWLRLLTGWHMRDWLAHTFSSLPLVTAPQVRSLRISWKKNGLEFDTVPVLGTADEIIVRAELRYSSSTPPARPTCVCEWVGKMSRRKVWFSLNLPGG
jgi:hypothetical protein